MSMTGPGWGLGLSRATRSNWSSEYVLTQKPEQRGPDDQLVAIKKYGWVGRKWFPS